MGEAANRGKMYQAPFDILLAKRFNRSTLHTVELYNHDKIIRLTVTTSGSYKSETTILQFEFTGKHTNVIIMDKDEVVLEALRHIDDEVSTRSVRVGQKLGEIPKPLYEPQHYPLEDVREFLLEEFRNRNSDRLDRLKNEKKSLLHKRLATLQKHLNALESESALMEESQKSQN